MDQSEAPFRRCTHNATEAQRAVTRRSLLSGAAGLADAGIGAFRLRTGSGRESLNDGKEWNNGY